MMKTNDLLLKLGLASILVIVTTFFFTMKASANEELIKDVFPDTGLAESVVATYNQNYGAALTTDSKFEELALHNYTIDGLQGEGKNISDLTGLDKLTINVEREPVQLSNNELSDNSNLESLFTAIQKSLTLNDFSNFSLEMNNNNLTNTSYEKIIQFAKLNFEKMYFYLYLNYNSITNFNILSEQLTTPAMYNAMSFQLFSQKKTYVYPEVLTAKDGVLTFDPVLQLNTPVKNMNSTQKATSPSTAFWGKYFDITNVQGDVTNTNIDFLSKKITWNGINEPSGTKTFKWRQYTENSGKTYGADQEVIVSFTSEATSSSSSSTSSTTSSDSSTTSSITSESSSSTSTTSSSAVVTGGGYTNSGNGKTSYNTSGKLPNTNEKVDTTFQILGILFFVGASLNILYSKKQQQTL